MAAAEADAAQTALIATLLEEEQAEAVAKACLLYTSPSPRDRG